MNQILQKSSITTSPRITWRWDCVGDEHIKTQSSLGAFALCIPQSEKNCTVMFTVRRICTVGLKWDNNCLMDWQNWTSSYYFAFPVGAGLWYWLRHRLCYWFQCEKALYTHTSQLYIPNFATSALIMNYSVIWHREWFPHSNLRWEVPCFSSPVDPQASVGQVSRWRISRPTADQWANSPLHEHPHSSGTNYYSQVVL